MAPIPRLRDFAGPAILSYGFRPFFLLGAAYAGLAILFWLPIFFGWIALPTAFMPRDWHVHEMLYGYVAAVITGFLLTAIPNWTGRMPLQGAPLAVLVAAWLVGRLAVACSGAIGPVPAAVADLAFLVIVAAACAREVLAGRNWRNLKVLVVLGIFLAGNVIFHVESIVTGAADYGIRIGIGSAILLVMLVGGRIVPSFTRNWLVRENPGRLPASLGRFDMASLALAAIAMAFWVVAPEGGAPGALLILAGLLQAIRLGRWAGDRTGRDPLVYILHLAYAFIPLGFWLLGAAAFGLVPESAGIHAWTGGAIVVMTLAVMTRASLGHTGRALVADRATQAIYAAAIVSALARIAAALLPAWSEPLLGLAGLAWAGAFLGYAAAYGPLLSRPRLSRVQAAA